MSEVASWEGREAMFPPLNFDLSESFVLVGKFLSKNTKFEAKNVLAENI